MLNGTKKTTLLVGNGEIGKSLKKVLEEKYKRIFIKDIEDIELQNVEILHICFPYYKKFVKECLRLIKKYKPELVIIHSSVPIGTTRKVGDIAVNSPIRGVHPNLIQGIKTFTKYFGGVSVGNVKRAAKIFSDVGIETREVYNPEETEAGKLLSTTYYSWCIMFEKWVKEFCEKKHLNFDIVYNHFNTTYNIGYAELNSLNFIRPIMKHMEGKIGGHCQISNAKLLKKDFKPAKIILKKNKKL